MDQEQVAALEATIAILQTFRDTCTRQAIAADNSVTALQALLAQVTPPVVAQG